MADRHCKTCRHWADSTAEIHEVFGGTERKQRACRRVIEGTLLVHDMTGEQRLDLPANVAYVPTGYVHAMALFTGPEFGCVHWQPTGEKE